MPALERAAVCIVGAGPAGCVAARLLALWGWPVALVHRRPSTRPLAESLPPSTRKLLALINLSAEVDAAGFLPNTGNTAYWAGQARRAIAPAPGLHVSRDTWDDLLLATARAAGVRVIEAAVRSVDGLMDAPCVTAVDTSGALRAIRAQYVLDCSGRSGIVARRGLRAATSYRTLAIAADWQAPHWPDGEHTQTVVESYDEGWSWSVPVTRTTRQCTVMVAPPGRDAGLRTELQASYLRELGRTRVLAARLGEAIQTGRPWACDASVYGCSRAADGRAILVGDAASFVEPLSSAGVKKAMLSAWRAAVVTNTCLRDSRRASVAIEYHCERERHVFESCARQASGFFAEAAVAHRTPFWSTRQQDRSGAPASSLADAADDDLLGADDVAATFERLRAGTAGRLRVSSRVRVAETATIEGDEVVLRDAVSLPGVAGPLRFASNVNLPALVGIVRRHDDVTSALQAYRTEIQGVAAADVLRGLSLLVAREAIVHEQDARL